MIKMSKLVIGVRPATRMFRLSSLSGVVIDEILAARGKKPLSDEYYKKVLAIGQNGEVRLLNDKKSNALVMNWSDVVFTKEAIDEEDTIDISSALEEFERIWKIIDEVARIRDVRRIGIFAEHIVGIGLDNASKNLLDKLTTIKKIFHPAKFSLSYEERRPTIEGMAPDIEKSDLINVRHTYYDGELDDANPIKQSIKADIDVQRYFTPLTSAVTSEVLKLKKVFAEEERSSIIFRAREEGCKR